MGRITSLFVHKAIRQADPRIDRRAMLRSIGVDPDAPVDPKVMVAADDYYTYLESLAAQDPNAIDLPLRVGASMRLDEYGAMGLAWKSAPNLRASWDRAERFAKVLTSTTTYEVREVALGAWLILHRAGERRLGMRLSNEASIASLAAISQQVTDAKVKLLEVQLEHAAPGRADVHERYFGCPVRFGAEDDGLLVDWETLRFPNRLSDPGMSQFFEAHLAQELARLDDDHSLPQRVRIEVSQALADGIPTISDTAKRLGMSTRTLQRRLSDSGHPYQRLIDDARRQLAEKLLRRTEYTLQEVAFLTGFSDQSAFTRAFKRWAGQTPRSFRIASQK